PQGEASPARQVRRGGTSRTASQIAMAFQSLSNCGRVNPVPEASQSKCGGTCVGWSEDVLQVGCSVSGAWGGRLVRPTDKATSHTKRYPQRGRQQGPLPKAELPLRSCQACCISPALPCHSSGAFDSPPDPAAPRPRQIAK